MICEKCPFKASLDVANELIQEVENLDKNRALGGIAITARSLELASNKLDCTGPVNNHSNEQECPVRNVAMLARTFAISPWSQSVFVADLEKGLITNQDVNSQSVHGNYI